MHSFLFFAPFAAKALTIRKIGLDDLFLIWQCSNFSYVKSLQITALPQS